MAVEDQERGGTDSSDATRRDGDGVVEIDARREKMERLRAEGIDPYPARHAVGHAHARSRRARARTSRPTLEHGAHAEMRYTIAGRLISRRGHGKTAFLDVRDLSGSIQVVVRVDSLGQETYDRILDLDIGDIVGVDGCVYVTQRGSSRWRSRSARC